MRVLKTAALAALTMSIISSCSSTKKVTESSVKTKEETIVETVPSNTIKTEKKTKLTATEAENWQHLDLVTDTIPGMSVDKAYKFLKGKTSKQIVVCVLDSGTDLKHEDLKDVAWVNSKEIAGNGIDDDKNGYIDDINGWNFLGKSYKENLEYERILMNPKITNAEELAEVKAFQKGKVQEAQQTKAGYSSMLADITSSYNLISNKLGKKDFKIKEVKALKADTPELKKAVAIANKMYGYGLSLSQAKKEISGIVEKADKVIKGDNLKTDYRKVVGDNAYDIKDKPGYGDGNTGSTTKEEAHGSHVSGIIAASRNNNKGMKGVANNVKIMAVRSVSDGDEYDKDIALGIRYAVDNGAKVINTSFGKAFSPKKQWVYDAIKYAAKHDVLIVNAAGNSGKNIDIEKTYPNDTPDLKNEITDNFITIGASTYKYNKNLPASFSNYGKNNVDIFAPGYQIYSSTPENEYKKFSGTSMAAPDTAGVAALIRSYYPKLSASQVKHIIMDSGYEIPFKVIRPGSKSQLTPNGILVPFADLSVSGKVVNAYNALKLAEKISK